MGPPRAATVLHADLDAFYASVEQLLDPSLSRRPIAVGTGVVLAASYEARAFGVSAGMPAWRARRLCPGLAFVPGHFREYQRLGDQVMDVLGAFTPVVERVSIDEAFLDVAGARRLFGPPIDIATAIRRRVREDVGLPLSIGVARTKHLAKVASQVAKPDGLVVVGPDDEAEFLARLPVGLIWGVGPVTRAQLATAGIRTIGELAAAPGALLDHLLGRTIGERLTALANNVDPRRIGPARPASSMGAQAALGRRRATPELLRSTLGYLADRVASRLRHAGRAARTVTVRVRFPSLRSVTRSTTLRTPVCATLTLTEIATDLAGAALAEHRAEREVTLLAVSVSNIVVPALQLPLPISPGGARPGPERLADAARWGADRSVDAVRARFGHGAVGYATVVFSDAARVPDEFRELAEHGPP
jgi:DNA polymerase-4